MTPTRPHDPTRTLDGVSPPEQWDDIVARADAPGHLDVAAEPGRGRRVPRPALVAAALLVVVGALGAFALTRSDPDDRTRVNGASDPHATFWGTRWMVEIVTRDDQFVASGSAPSTLVLDTRTTGTIRFEPCVLGIRRAHLDGDRLRSDPPARTRATGCAPGAPGRADQALTGAEAFLTDLLDRDPTVAVADDTATLTAGPDQATLRRLPADPPAGRGERRWVAVAGTVDGAAVDLAAARGFVVRTDGDELTVDGLPCRRYVGPTVDGAWLPAVGRGTCVEPTDSPQARWADVLFGATNEFDRSPVPAATVTVDGDRLTMAHTGATFTFQVGDDPAGLWGRRWTVARITVDGAPVPLLALPAGSVNAPGPTVDTAQPDGQVYVRGCNTLGRPARLVGDLLVADGNAGGSTLMRCPDDLAAQDRLLAKVLDRAVVVVRGDRLLLVGADVTVELRDGVAPPVTDPPPGTDPPSTTPVPPGGGTPAAAPADLLVDRWEVVALAVDGAASPDLTVAGPRPFVDGATRGRLLVDGANTLTASARLDGATLVLDGALTTLVGVPPEAQALDTRLFTLFESMPTVAGAGPDRLTVTAGDTVATLRRFTGVRIEGAALACDPVDGTVGSATIRSARPGRFEVRVRRGDVTIGQVATVDVAGPEPVDVRLDLRVTRSIGGPARVEVAATAAPGTVLAERTVPDDLPAPCR